MITVLQALPAYVGAAAALGAVAVAWFGLQTWRRQLQGTAEYDLARRVLRAVLEVRNEIAAVRNPLILPAEIEQAEREQDASKVVDSRQQNEHQLAYGRHWSSLVKARSQLTIELLEAEVLWGERVREPEKLLNKCIGEVWLAVNRHIREMTNQNAPRETEEQWQKRQVILYDDGSEANEFTSRVAAAVTEFEKLLRPHIGARHFPGASRSVE